MVNSLQVTARYHFGQVNGLLLCLSYDGEILPRVSVSNTWGPQLCSLLVLSTSAEPFDLGPWRRDCALSVHFISCRYSISGISQACSHQVCPDQAMFQPPKRHIPVSERKWATNESRYKINISLAHLSRKNNIV
jgi:hypothetical protein